MIISLIAAVAENSVIGRNGALPWHIPSDLKRFNDMTRGHTVIMGRKTFESIGRPLPGRRNIVLTRRRGYQAEGCDIVHDLDSAFAACAGEAEVFIGGGGEVYAGTIHLADRIYLTCVKAAVEGDTLFPEIPGDFIGAEQGRADDVIPTVYILLTRKVGTSP
ncbi:MAG: dihydrofolate reductase [Nitrospirae bacterium GWC2_57_13]|jgi:dihydrofolate reductase|nr:MAG: dihydrofolate reductase [Nitrospirae bacterium GWC2_57_13]